MTGAMPHKQNEKAKKSLPYLMSCLSHRAQMESHRLFKSSGVDDVNDFRHGSDQVIGGCAIKLAPLLQGSDIVD